MWAEEDLLADKFEEFVDAFVTRVPGPIGAATTVLLYAGLGLALPLSLHWRMVFLVEANAVGTVLAAVVAGSWFIVKSKRGTAVTCWSGLRVFVFWTLRSSSLWSGNCSDARFGRSRRLGAFAYLMEVATPSI